MDKLAKMRRHHWKKLLKISKISKFECDLIEKKMKIIIAPQSGEILRTFVWWRVQTCP